MKTIACLILSIVAVACHSQERYVTLTLKGVTDSFGGFLKVTNSFEIVDGETAHLVTMVATATPRGPASAYAQKDGESFLLAVGPPPDGRAGGPGNFQEIPTPPAVAGPAKLMLVGQGGLATFRITPNFSDPQKTVIVLPGAENAAQITLQCSTNLSTWVPATNGLYSGDVAKFFRIHLEKGKP